LPVLQVNSRSIDQKSGEIWTGQADLQPISFKSDRLLGHDGINDDRHALLPGLDRTGFPLQVAALRHRLARL